jgi:hypothetical protein
MESYGLGTHVLFEELIESYSSKVANRISVSKDYDGSPYMHNISYFEYYIVENHKVEYFL